MFVRAEHTCSVVGIVSNSDTRIVPCQIFIWILYAEENAAAAAAAVN